MYSMSADRSLLLGAVVEYPVLPALAQPMSETTFSASLTVSTIAHGPGPSGRTFQTYASSKFRAFLYLLWTPNPLKDEAFT